MSGLRKQQSLRLMWTYIEQYAYITIASLKFYGGGGGSEKRQSLPILGLQRLASLLKNLCRGS